MVETTQKTIKYPEFKELFNVFIRYCLSQYKLILLLIIVGGVIGLIYGKSQSPNYVGVSTFIIEDKSGSRGGGISGLASQFGIDVASLTGGGAGLFEGENIFEIMKSRIIVDKVLNSKIEEDVPEKGMTLAQYYLIKSGLDQKLKSKQIDAVKLFSHQEKALDRNTQIIKDSVSNILYNNIVNGKVNIEKQNKKSSIITLSVSSTDQVFTKNFTDKLLKETSNLYIEIKTGNLSRNIAQLQLKVDSLQYILNSKSDIRNYINLSAPYEGASRDKTVATALYTDVVKNLESMRLSLINQTPVIQVLDSPRYPILNQKVMARFYLLIGAMIGFLISFFYILYKYTSK
jgi:uncharacterized protein involved in exopolysaccharide biosynthesis